MIAVSNDFKQAMKATTKELFAKVTYDDNGNTVAITESDDLYKLKLYTETSLLHTVIRKATFSYFGNVNLLDKDVNIYIGVKLADGTVEYINYGTFTVKKVEHVKDKNITTAEAYDKLGVALQKWQAPTGLTYPVTLHDYFTAVLSDLGLTLDPAITDYPNRSQSIEGEPYGDTVSTYREVLDDIAEATGSIIYMGVNDNVQLKQIAVSGYDEDLTLDILNKLEVQAKWGVVNSVVLAREPQGDYITQQDQQSINDNGLTEVKITNNTLVDPDRNAWIGAIYDALHNLQFYPFKAEYNGLGYLEVGDRVLLHDLAGNTFEGVVLGLEINMQGGMREVVWAKRPDKTSTNYQYAGKIGTQMHKTEIIVNKLDGEIKLINQNLDENYYTKAEVDIEHNSIRSSVQATDATANSALDLAQQNAEDLEGVHTDITTLEQRADSLELSVKGIGGANLIRNSSGRKGDVNDWQERDNDGNLLDPANTAEIVQDTEVQIYTEADSAFKLMQNWLKQAFNVIPNETYTFYCRYKSNADATITIGGITTQTLPNSNEQWQMFKFTFTPVNGTTYLKIDNTNVGVNEYLLIADIVIKKGDVSGWIQAPNEIYGKNYRFDKDGFTITSPDNSFKSLLDNTKLAVYDTSTGSDKVVMLVSKDSGKITNLVAQTQFTIQRYDNPAKRARFIPTSTGVMLVIND